MASTERKSIYPPDADRDQLLQLDGTARTILRKPGRPFPGPVYGSTERVAEQARTVAFPTEESCVNEIMTSK